MTLKIVQPYDRGLSIREYYLNELKLNQPHIYIYYQDEEGKQYMKKFKKHEAQVLINDL